MKYKMERTETENVFKPFKIVIEIETREDYVHFHDNVAGKITGGSHNFIGELYEMGRSKIDSADGKI